MATSIPPKEFKEAIKALNVVLKSNEETPIKMVGVKKEQVQKKFTDIILDFIENDRSDELPDEAIDVYNEYIANEDEAEAEVEEKTTAKGKPAAKGKATAKGKAAAGKSAAGKGKATAKGKAAPPKGKAAPPKGGKSVVELTVDLFMKEGLRENSAIVKKLEKKFPGRNIASTVSSAMCVLKHVAKHM